MAASAGGIRAGQAYVELLADDSKLRRGLTAAQQRLSEWGASIRTIGLAVSAAGAGILTPLIAAAKQFAHGGAELALLAARTGMSVERLSELKFAAGETGAGLEDLERASRHLSVTITDAMNGSRDAIDKLGGVNLAKQLAKLAPDEQFLVVAKAIGQIQDPTRRAAAAVAVFGRTGTALLPLIEHLDELRAKAHQLGATTTTEAAEKARRLEVAWDNLTGASKRISSALGSTIAPALTNIINDITPWLVRVKEWIKSHQDVVVSAAKVGAVLVGVGSVIIGISAILTGAAWVMRGLGVAVTAVGKGIGAVQAIISGTAIVWRFLTTSVLTASWALRAVGAASAGGSAALAAARVGVLTLALAFGRVRLAALTAFSGLPGLVVRFAGTAMAAAASVRSAAARGPGVTFADRGRSVLQAGGQAATAVANGAGSALQATGVALGSLPGRIGGAFTAMGRVATGALGSVRTALAGVQVAASMLGTLVVNGVTRGFAAIPGIAARAVAAIPALLGSAWSGIGGVVSAGVGVVRIAFAALPGLASSVGTAVVGGLGRAIAAVPGLLLSALGVIATAIQAIPSIIMGGFALLRTTVMALPALFSAAFSILPGLIAIALNPVTLLGGAIVGLGIYLYQTSDGGRQALSQLGQAFAEVKDDAVTAFGAISDALSAGDIMGAVKILWAFIQLEWTRGIAVVENVMQAFAGGVAKLFLNVGFGINTGFWTVANGIQDAMEWVVGGIIKLFTSALGAVAEKIASLLELVGVLDEGASAKVRHITDAITTGVDRIRQERAAERDQKVTDLKGLWDEKVGDVNAWMVTGMQGRDADIAAKRAELDQAIADVKRAEQAKRDAGEQGDGVTEPRTSNGIDLDKLMRDLAAGLNTVQLKVDTLGTFNPAAIEEVGIGGTAAERGLQAAEKTARNTERLANSVESNPLTYG